MKDLVDLVIWFGTEEPPGSHKPLVSGTVSYCPACTFITHMIELISLITDLALEAGPSVLRCRYCGDKVVPIIPEINGWTYAGLHGFCSYWCLRTHRSPALRLVVEML